MIRPHRLSDPEVTEWLREHPAWRVVDEHLVRDIRTIDYPSAVRLAQAQVEIAERLDHHPVLTIGYRQFHVELWTHDRDGVTKLDTQYALELDELVASQFHDIIAD